MITDGIIFDIDGTIWDTTEIVAKGWNRAIRNNFPQIAEVTGQILKGQFGKTMKVIADNLFPSLKEQQKDVLMKVCCKEEQAEISAATGNLAYPHVVDTIQKLSEKHRLFIVSNCQKGYCELVMEKNNITKYITDFECFGNNGKNKTENLLLVKTRNNLHNPVYVGDTQSDADSCKQAGIPFVWASYGFGSDVAAEYRIDDFSQLLKLFA